jgi:hypothetical protein
MKKKERNEETKNQMQCKKILILFSHTKGDWCKNEFISEELHYNF